MREERYGGLTCRITGGSDRQGGGSGPIVILLHGFGASGSDLVSLWRVLDVPSETRFVFPEAPIRLDMGMGDSRAWWMVDFARFEGAGAVNPVETLARDTPDGLSEARALVRSMLSEVDRELGPGSPMILGGFSQGAMLSCDVALYDERPLAGLALMSGALIAREEWRLLLSARKGLNVMQSHGRQDPILPFASAEALRDFLTSGGLEVDWLAFNGGHTIPDGALTRLATLINSVSAK